MQDQVGQAYPRPTSSRQQPVQAVKKGDRNYRNHLNPREAESHLQEALNEYTRALEQTPDCPELMGKIAKVYMRLGLDAKAEQCAQKALKQLQHKKISAKGPVEASASLVLGTLSYSKSKLKEAQKYFLQAVKADPFKSSASRFCLYKIYFNRLWQNPLRPTGWINGFKAAYSLLTAILLFPFTEERMALSNLLLLIPQLGLAWMREELGMREDALHTYLDVHRQFPGLPAVSLVIGEIYRDKGRPDESKYWFEKAIDRHPDNLNAYYHLARLLEEREDFAGMAEVYEKLIQIAPNLADLHCNLGNAYYYTGQYKDSMTQYAIALQLGKDHHWKAMVAQSMANIQADYLQNTEAAIAYYEMASILDPQDVENHIQMGMLYFQRDDFDNAEMIYRKALLVAPKHPKLYSNLGYLRWMANDVDEAVTLYEQAIALDPDYEIPINNLGVIYLDMLGQVQKSITLFREALEIDPNYALAYYNLGRAYSFLGDRTEAANCFQSAQKLNQHSNELDNDELTARINHLFETREIEFRD